MKVTTENSSYTYRPSMKQEKCKFSVFWCEAKTLNCSAYCLTEKQDQITSSAAALLDQNCLQCNSLAVTLLNSAFFLAIIIMEAIAFTFLPFAVESQLWCLGQAKRGCEGGTLNRRKVGFTTGAEGRRPWPIFSLSWTKLESFCDSLQSSWRYV